MNNEITRCIESMLRSKIIDLSILPERTLEIEPEDAPSMADTIGSISDKLSVVNLKMFWNQEDLYIIRRMSKDEFIEKYGNADGQAKLYDILKRCCDLNVLRNQLIDELDERIFNLASATGMSKEKIDSLRLRAPSHKTY